MTVPERWAVSGAAIFTVGLLIWAANFAAKRPLMSQPAAWSLMALGLLCWVVALSLKLRQHHQQVTRDKRQLEQRARNNRVINRRLELARQTPEHLRSAYDEQLVVDADLQAALKSSSTVRPVRRRG